jgi:hypothetical protein
LDIQILYRSISKVLSSEGINAVDTATIEPFDGE